MNGKFTIQYKIRPVKLPFLNSAILIILFVHNNEKDGRNGICKLSSRTTRTHQQRNQEQAITIWQLNMPLTLMELLKAIKNLLSHVATHIEKPDFPARFVYLEEYIPPEKLRGFRPTLLS